MYIMKSKGPNVYDVYNVYGVYSVYYSVYNMYSVYGVYTTLQTIYTRLCTIYNVKCYNIVLYIIVNLMRDPSVCIAHYM